MTFNFSQMSYNNFEAAKKNYNSDVIKQETLKKETSIKVQPSIPLKIENDAKPQET